jgi:hypothetical protein
VGGEKEAAGAASGIADRLPGPGRHDLDDGGDERAGGEVLAGAALHVSGVFFEQALVGVALHIGVEHRPRFLVNEVDDEAAELGRVLDLVLRLAEDGAEHPGLLSQRFENVTVVRLQLIDILGEKTRPIVALRHRGLVACPP